MSSKNKKVAVAVVADFPFLLKYFKNFIIIYAKMETLSMIWLY